MKEINNEKELLSIEGGMDISGSLINAFNVGIKTILEVGRSFGTSIRRLISGNLCKIC